MSLFTITRDKGGVIAWTEEQVAYIIDKYTNENYSLKQLGREFGCTYTTIKNCLNKHGISSRGNKQGYPRNELYFYSINTADKAYWLGFLYADGTVASGKNRYDIGITLKDLEHLNKFKNAIGAVNHKITEIGDNRFKDKKTLYRFSIKDKQLHEDLCKWGCVPNKTFLISTIPNIPYHLISHFLRGYFDGDGSLHYLQGTNNYRISFACGSKSFLETIKNILQVKVSIGQNPNSNTYYIQIAGRKQVIRILKYLYQDSNVNNRLDRKYSKYLDCLEWARRH